MGRALLLIAFGAAHATQPGSVGILLEALHIREAPGEDPRQRVDIDHRQLALVLGGQTAHQLLAQHVDPTVKHASLHRDLTLSLSQILDQLFELGVGQGGEVGKRFQLHLGDSFTVAGGQHSARRSEPSTLG